MLAIFPFFTLDFLPDIIIYSTSLVLFFRSFFIFNNYLIYILLSAGTYYIFSFFGLIITPESSASFLSIVVTAKLLKKEAGQSSSFIWSFLLVCTYSLFNHGLIFLIFLATFLYFNLTNFKEKNNSAQISTNLRDSLIPVVSASLIIILLFLIFPRFNNFLPFANTPQKNEIGYTTKINNSTSNNLQTSNKVAFYAYLNKDINQSLLYWRGRVLDYTDGYDWSTKNNLFPPSKILESTKSQPIEYALKYEQSFEGDLILLDTPLKVLSSSSRFYQKRDDNSFHFYRNKQKAKIDAISTLQARHLQKIDKKLSLYLQLPEKLPLSLLDIYKTTKSSDISTLIFNIKTYLNDNEFEYTLSPGRLPTLDDFLKQKKGFCTHYASLVALLLRKNQVPARLVSGFQGGIKNSYGQFYTIRSKDAHAWIEYFHKGSWQRLDPVEFISKIRINAGVEEFLISNKQTDRPFFSFYEIRQLINNLDFQIISFLEGYDKQKQKELAQKLELKLNKLTLIIFSIIILIIIAAWFAHKLINTPKRSLEDRLMLKFIKICKKRNLTILNNESEIEILAKLKKKSFPLSFFNFVEIYQDIKYRKAQRQIELKDLLKKLT